MEITTTYNMDQKDVDKVCRAMGWDDSDGYLSERIAELIESVMDDYVFGLSEED